MNITHLPVILPLIYITGALLAPILGGFKRSGIAFFVTVIFSLMGVVASTLGLCHVIENGTLTYTLAGWSPSVGIQLILDPLSAFICWVVAAVSFVVLFYSKEVLKVELPNRRGPFLVVALLLIAGLLGISLTGDLFNLYVFLEITSLAMYIILSIGGDKRAPVSVFRYLILGTLGASFYLMGIGFILFETGSLNMQDVAQILSETGINQPAIMLGVLMMIIGISMKMAIFPLHGWLPDVYSHASSIGTSLIAPIGTKVAAYVVLRLLFFVVRPEVGEGWLSLYTIIGTLGAIGIVWGSIMAVAQSDLKRMLAYSSVGQLGYIAVGIGLASPLGLVGALLHVLNHACMKAALFLVSSNIFSKYGHTDISKLEPSIRKKMPWTSITFVLAALSMIGLPPTAGFFSKWYLLRASLEGGEWFFIVAIVLSSLLNAVYFFRIVERMYLRNESQTEEVSASGTMFAGIKPSMKLGTVVLGASILVFGFGNVWIVENVLLKIGAIAAYL